MGRRSNRSHPSPGRWCRRMDSRGRQQARPRGRGRRPPTSEPSPRPRSRRQPRAKHIYRRPRLPICIPRNQEQLRTVHLRLRHGRPIPTRNLKSKPRMRQLRRARIPPSPTLPAYLLRSSRRQTSLWGAMALLHTMGRHRHSSRRRTSAFSDRIR